MGVTHLDGFPDEGFDLAPTVPKVGPFPTAAFLRAWWEEIRPEAQMFVVNTEDGVLPLMQSSGVVQFLGDTDLADYHSPLGQDIDGPVRILAALQSPGMSIDLDSLPVEGALPIAESLSKSGLFPKMSEQTIAMVLHLPESIDAYYSMIGKKERHELRRKGRRYEEQIGPATISTDTGAGFGFDEFVRLHRLAPGNKGTFMTGERHRFFSKLAGQDGWRVDYLDGPGGATACLFGWTDGSDYYLYNSSYDPAFQAASPGQVLLTGMIEHAITEGWGVFDFLKGDEAYKARLGATPRQLYRVEA
jgi:CelD/BcsL family acetyltransferase involved in cellulose biosynthesis